MNLFEYQKHGRNFLVNNKHALLGDQPGLGKTPQAITAARSTLGTTNILVLCPLSAVGNWRREWKRWWPTFKGELRVVNYDKLSVGDQWRKYQRDWDLIIVDEAHRLKSTSAVRTQRFYRHIAPLAQRVWLLTGTPAPNHTGELFTHIRALRPDLLKTRNGRPMDETQFQTEYCRVLIDRHGNEKVAGSKNVGVLRDKLEKSGFFLRRTKAQVQQELPPLIWDTYPIKVNAGAAILPSLPSNYVGLTEDQLLEELRLGNAHMATERRELGLLKVEGSLDAIRDELDQVDKVLVFALHRSVIDALIKGLSEYSPVGITGGMTSKMRDTVIDAFQTDPKVRVFVGQIQACGEAITLTAASRVFFVEAAWTPSDNFQAACRAHRHGQKDKVVVRFLSVPNSLDDLIQRTLARKSAELAELFD